VGGAPADLTVLGGRVADISIRSGSGDSGHGDGTGHRRPRHQQPPLLRTGVESQQGLDVVGRHLGVAERRRYPLPQTNDKTTL